MLTQTLATIIRTTDVDVPDIAPDFSAPWMAGMQVIVSYILATAILIALGATIFAVLALIFAKAFPDRARSWAGDSIVWLIIGVIALGAVGGLFQFFINFDFGF